VKPESELWRIYSRSRSTALQTPHDIEEADDAIWRKSAAFEYLWDLHGEPSYQDLGRETEPVFQHDLLNHKRSVPLLREMFFDVFKLMPGTIETEIDASKEREHMTEVQKRMLDEGQIFRVVNRKGHKYKFKHDENDTKSEFGYKTSGGQLRVNGVSRSTGLFRGNQHLNQLGDKSYVNTVTRDIWFRASRDSFKVTKGIWFDAFVDICTDMGLPLDRTSSWIMWNLMTSEELMKDENVDIILCKDIRLQCCIKRADCPGVSFASSDGSWEILVSSNRILKLKQMMRVMPARGNYSVDLTASKTVKRMPTTESVAGQKPKSKHKEKQQTGPKVDVAGFTELNTSQLVFLNHDEDKLSFTVLHKKKIVGKGTLPWSKENDNMLLTKDHIVPLYLTSSEKSEPVNVGSLCVKLDLDSCYEEIFATIDREETHRWSIMRFKRERNNADVAKAEANSFQRLPTTCLAGSSQTNQDNSSPPQRTSEYEMDSRRQGVEDWYWGFCEPFVIQQNLLKVLRHTPFVSKTMFRVFLEHAGIDLPTGIIDHLWDNDLEKNFPLQLRWGGSKDIVKVHGLVSLADCWKRLKHLIYDTGKSWFTTAQEKKEYHIDQMYIGGIWFAPFYNTLMSQCNVVEPEQSLRQIYDAYLDSQTGLMPVNNVYDAIERIGRPGLTYEHFKRFVEKLGISIDDQHVEATFQQVDVNENHCLDKEELKASALLLLAQTLPRMLLEKQNLTVELIVPHIVMLLAVLVLVFLFLLLSFKSFVGGSVGSVFQTLVQSGLALGATVTLKGESGVENVEQLGAKVIRDMENIFGVTSPSNRGA